MNRFVAWICSFIAIGTVLSLHGPWQTFIDLSSVALQGVPLLMLLTVFPTGTVVRALTDLAAPDAAGIAPARFRENAEVFEMLGVLAVSNGTLLSVVGIIQMLATLADPNAVPKALGIALLTLLYSLIIALLIALPGALISRRAAARAMVIEE